MATAVWIAGRSERQVGIKDIVDGLTEQTDELLGMGSDIDDGFAAQTEGWVIAFSSGMLDEEEGRGDGRSFKH